jgi:hemoglobin
MKDITSREDIVLLVNSFYDKVNQDDLLKPIFRHVNWPAHLPIMYNFWSSMLLGDQSYQGNPFQKHVHLSIDSTHFHKWYELFTQTVDEHFNGSKADEAKSRAQSIAGVWQHKLGLLK